MAASAKPKFCVTCSLEGHCLSRRPVGTQDAGPESAWSSQHRPVRLPDSGPLPALVPPGTLGWGEPQGWSGRGLLLPCLPLAGSSVVIDWGLVFDLPSPRLQCELLGRWVRLSGLALTEPHKRELPLPRHPRVTLSSVPPSLTVPIQVVLSLSQQ